MGERRPRPHMKVVVKDGVALWWCNGWTDPSQLGAWILWWYDGDLVPAVPQSEGE